MNKFDKFKWFIEANKYKLGDCFGQVIENEEGSKGLGPQLKSARIEDHESIKVKERAGLIMLEKVDYVQAIQKVKDKLMIDKYDFLFKIPLIKTLPYFTARDIID